MSSKTTKRTQFYMSKTHLYHNTISKQDVLENKYIKLSHVLLMFLYMKIQLIKLHGHVKLAAYECVKVLANRPLSDVENNLKAHCLKIIRIHIKQCIS
jgi:hypothetical protein